MSGAPASAGSAPPPPLLWRMLTAWGDLRASMRGILDERPGEGRLLLFAMLSGLIVFLGQVSALWLSPATATLQPDLLSGQVAASFIGAIFFRTLALYGVAGIVGLIVRRVRPADGEDWHRARASVFWSALIASPIELPAKIASTLFMAQGTLPSAAVSGLGSLVFAVALAYCLAEAFGFRRAWMVFTCVALVALGVAAAIHAIGTL